MTNESAAAIQDAGTHGTASPADTRDAGCNGRDPVFSRMRHYLQPIIDILDRRSITRIQERNQTMTVQTQNTKTVDNGVNVEALLGAREALEAAHEAAQFTWRATCEWVNGTHSRTSVNGFFGLGTDHERTKTFTVDTDHPEVFAAQDNAPTPVEVVLSGLAGCLSAGVAAVAQRRGIQLRSVRATLEGDMDLYGILGIDADVRNGFKGIRVNFQIDADATEDEVRALVAQSQRRSAVFDIITNPTNVHVTVG